ncbi:Metaxin-2 [Basidiobolus ranarum]|uniref:Metaxin-2 n=1 Tax=Basidiobolus ranarum TaxID=34480 RepID=A0ABR2W3E2_9FUNG
MNSTAFSRKAAELSKQLRLDQFPVYVHPSVFTPAELSKPTLVTYGPGWKNQPTSFDPECLKWQTYLNILAYDYDIVYSNEPSQSPDEQLPYLVTVEKKCLTGEKILKYAKGQDPEKYAPEGDELISGDDKAFVSLVETNIKVATLFYFWCEASNYSEQTFEKYTKSYIWPLDKLIGYKMRSTVIDFLLTKKPILLKEEIYNEASQALQALSNRLGDAEYFSGEKAGYLDAVVFAYLHTILAAPLPNSELRQIVQQHENLVKFAKSLWEQYYSSN